LEAAHGPVDSRAVGLDPPRHVIGLRAGGRAETLFVGEVEPLGRQVYVRRAGHDGILLATRNIVTLLQDTPQEFVDTGLLRGLAGPVQRVELSGPDGRLVAEHLGQGWSLACPEPVLPDGDRLNLLVRSLQTLQSERMLLASPTDAQLVELGLPTRAQAAAGGPAGATHIVLHARDEAPVGAWLAAGWREEPGEVHGVRDDFAKVLVVPRAGLAVLANPPGWFRDTRLLPPIRERAESLRLERGGELLLDIRRGAGGRWTFSAPARLAGQPVDAERVEGHSPLSDLLSRIDALTVRAFVPPPTGTPVASLVAGWTHSSRLRQDRVELHLVDGRTLALSSERPTEGLELPPDALELFTPLVADLLRPLRPLALDEAAWVALRIEGPSGPPLGIRREPGGPWTGDDEWTRATSLGHDLLRGLRGFRWEPAPPAAEYSRRVTFLDAGGAVLAQLRLRPPATGEPTEALGFPCARAEVSGHAGVELLLHRDWIERIDGLHGPLKRDP
ncbi:MAG: DUF4340 domain-containing protein, partial [Planctomycetes bacterium]|nr:DUF4340 domain-containing protein [Planctomycetota bacterium]